MRTVAFDVGSKRTGVAVSDASGTIARPYATLTGSGDVLVEQAVALIERLRQDDDGLGGVVVGWPRRLDGSANAQTPRCEAFAAAIAARTGLPVSLQDERLTSVDADAKLALRERDWRARKRRVDAAAAALILQDHLDRHADERFRASLDALSEPVFDD